MIDFGLDEDARILVDTVRAFARNELRPNLRAFEDAGGLPPSLDTAFHGLGVTTLSLPEHIGGSGMGERLEVLVQEELGAGDLGTSFALTGPGSFGLALQLLGDEAQQKQWLTPFVDDATRRGAVAYSEPTGHPDDGLRTIARRDGNHFVINGEKAAVLHGAKAAVFVIFAQVEGEGLGAFVVERDRAGLAVGERLGTLAFDAAGLAPVTLKDVRVPASSRLQGQGDFARQVQAFFVRAALRGAARVLGGARAAYEEALTYAETRVTFGKPIGHHQAIGFLLADMATAVDAMRWLVWNAAAAVDAGREDALLQACKAVAEVQESAMWVTNQAVQVHGGAGFIQDLPLEKWMREAKAAMWFGLTPQSADEITASLMLGANDPNRQLPAAAIQGVLL